MFIAKNGRPIRSLHDWAQLAGPKRKHQWQDWHSAKEAARAWLAAIPKLPHEIEAALTASEAFDSLVEWSAEPEVRLYFDEFSGEPRNTNLLVRGRDARGGFLMAVEAKAAESFGETVGQALAVAHRRREKNPRSRGVERIHGLIASLFGTSLETEPALLGLRYQLLTATAGALSAARRAGGVRVIMLGQEFRSEKTPARRCDANAADLDGFAARLTRGLLPAVKPGRVFGPYETCATEAAPPPLSFLKVTRDLK